MSQDGKKLQLPEIKVDEESTSGSSVGDIVRRLSASENLVSPQSGRRSPGFNMAGSESLRSALGLKRDSIEKEFEKLEASLKEEPPNASKIDIDVNFLRAQIREVRNIHNKLLDALFKEKDNTDCQSLEDNMGLLTRRFTKLELEAQRKLNPKSAAKVTAPENTDDTRAAGGASATTMEWEMADTTRATVTEILDKLEEALNADDVDLPEIEQRREMLSYCYTDFQREDTTYRDSLREAGRTVDWKRETIEARRIFQRKLALDMQARDKLAAASPPANSLSAAALVMRAHADSKSDDNLPKLSNNVKEWLPFWALFKDTDSNPHLSELQKFSKLIKRTKEGSEAWDIVHAYAMDSSNYKVALQHLKDTYGKPNVLIKVYVRELLQLGLDRAMGKTLEFRKLVNEISALMRNLEMLGVTTNECAQILYAVLETCLPKQILQSWQHDNNHSDDLEKLMKFLRTEVDHENERRLAHFNFPDAKPKEKGGGGKFGGRSQKEGGNKEKRGATPTASAFHNGESSHNCLFCDNRHSSASCKKALKLPFAEKQEKIKASGACFVCLEKGHMVRNCPDKGKIKCASCGKTHQKVLCPKLESGNENQQRTEENFANRVTSVNPQPPQTSNNNDEYAASQAGSVRGKFAHYVESDGVPLQMLLVTVEGARGRKKTVRAMLDTGSMSTNVTESLAKELGLEVVRVETVQHELFGGVVTEPQTQPRVKLSIAGPGGESPRPLFGSVVPRISRPVKTSPKRTWVSAFRERGVFLPEFTSAHKDVELMIGNNVVKLRTHREVALDSGIVAEETIWGWVLSGEEETPHNGLHERMSNLHITTSLANASIPALWELDLIGIRDEPSTQSKEDLAKETEEHFRQNLKVNEEGRYEVKLPFFTGAIETLPSNFYSAEKRLKTTTENLRKTGYLQQYDDLFKLWEAKKMIESVPTENNTAWRENGHFLPHRAVVKLSSATTPVRPVFDASAKQKGRPSLNMCLDAGPNYLELIPSIMTRFRLRRVGVTSDIAKAFQQISIAPEHRPFLRFVWWENIPNCDKLKVYQHTRVPFGVSCSPFLLAATLQHHLSLSPESHKKSAEKLQRSLYVDNCLDSLSSWEEAVHFQEQCCELLDPAHFDLRGWEIGPTEEEKEVSVLGMTWDMRRDHLLFDLESALEKVTSPPSQRNVLALAHSLFDPLGMLSPYILLAKLLLRKCHEEKLGWDKPLPAHLLEEFRKWSVQIPLIKDVCIPRYVHLDRSHDTSLHVFSDANGDAYAAAVYLRCETDVGVIISLLQSKARIATKAMRVTIPRLELIGCLIGVRLAATVVEDMEELNIPITYYTDSSTALAWIKGEGPWGIFVTNRVREINEKTSPEQWRHVRGVNNPADLPSRGCSAKKLLEGEWWLGPNWLYESREKWPVSTEIAPDPEAVEKEKKKTVQVKLAIQQHPPPMENFLSVSSYPKMLRLTCYWLRYRQILRDRIRHPCPPRLHISRRPTTELIQPPSVPERDRAEKVILQFAQKNLNEKHLKKLRPFECDGLMRTSTPVMFDEEEYFTHPIILPDNNEFVMRMLRHIHQDNCHIGTQLLLAKIREKFWLINGRRTCRKVVTECWACRRFKAKRLTVPEPPLPRARTETGVPFNVIGVDMAGPLYPKDGGKVWIALFTCATYRAIHLEVVDGMSTEEFLTAFRAFTSRRGKPSIVYSDNGLNFVGANAALQRIYKEKVEHFAQERRIQWRFLPPSAPWWGAFYERLIGLMKQLMRSILEKRVVKRKELVGLLMEVEEACNNRPLTYLSESPNDPVPLTPNHMIRDSGLSYFPELEIRDASSARAAMKRIQRLRESLRSRFRREYLGALQNRRNNGVFKPLKPGDVVLLEQENEKRVNWPLGVIVGVIKGRDGFPREYRVRTKFGVVPRAAQRLFPMELNENEKACATGVVQGEDRERTAPGSGMSKATNEENETDEETEKK